MPNYTDNLGLIQPLGSEKIRIAQINQNMDTLDEAVGAVGDKSLQQQILDIGGGIAIMANGNTHPAITAGQFVFVRNHGTLADGAYTANSNIAENATLSSSNLTAVPGGGFNALKAGITSLSDQIENKLVIESKTVSLSSGVGDISKSGYIPIAAYVEGATSDWATQIMNDTGETYKVRVYYKSDVANTHAASSLTMKVIYIKT